MKLKACTIILRPGTKGGPGWVVECDQGDAVVFITNDNGVWQTYSIEEVYDYVVS